MNFLKKNIKRFNIEDFTITAIKKGSHWSQGKKEKISPCELSALCMDNHKDKITVYSHEEVVGEIDSNNCFHYTKIRDLKTIVAWLLVTDAGRMKILNTDLEVITFKVEKATKGGREYIGDFGDTIVKIFTEEGSLYADNYTFTLWWGSTLSFINTRFF